jgi:LuxR family maltose regulon positive regulatory protein
MQGRDDVAGFIAGFAGDDRYIVDYLVEEVLQRQPERDRSFLLQTSILDRLSGPLCDAVTGQDGGKATLEALERGNLFLVPLDDRRRWYRYHQLFADVLRAHLLDEQPDGIPDLHRRASAWCEQHGESSEAIRHALAAGDVARAADLVERAVPAMFRSRREATVLGWLRALPAELVRCRPVLSVGHAHALLASGELEGVEDRLRDAERWLDTAADRRARPEAPAAAMVVVDDEAFRRLPGAIAVARAGQALALGDVAATVRHARRVLDLVPEDDHLGRGSAAGLLGLASWTSGELEAAHRTYAEGMAHLQLAGNIADAIGGTIALADIRIAQGRLREAMRTYERALQLAAEQGTPVLRGTADMYVGMSEIHREWDELDAATQHLLRSQEQGEHTGFPQYRYRWRVAMARIREAHGDLDGALDLLHEAERLYVSDFYPNVRPVAALKARMWVAQGRLADALAWARERGLSAEDDPSYLREFEHTTLARVLIALYRRDRDDRSIHEAMGLLGRLLRAAEAGGRTGSAIDILVLQALAYQAHGDLPAALAPLERALTLAEPEGYVRLFVDEGAAMHDLLRHAAARGVASAYTRRLLSAFDRPVPPGAAPARAEGAELAESLTAREVEILRLIAAGLRNQEIAAQLYIGLATVKRHIANAYGKLGVSHRTEAVARANELHLL